MADTKRDIAFSLPHVIVTPIQCSFGTYFWEMYQSEFGWTKAEWGVVSWIYNFTQLISYLALGGIFIFIDSLSDEAPRWWSLGIEAFAVIIHASSYFFLIILPIKWHGVKTPLVDSLFGKASNFRQAMFGGPVPLSSMATSRGWYRFFCIPWAFVKFFWVILYPLARMCFSICCGIMNMSMTKFVSLLSFPFKCCRKHKPKVVSITQIPGTAVYEGELPDLGAFIDAGILPVLETLESIPDPACSACCNTTCCNNFAMRLTSWKTFMGTRTFGIYMLAVMHGVGISMFELCNKALPVYIYNDPVSNGEKIGKAITVNVSFLTTANFFVILLFSLVKFYVPSGARLAETYYLISILFLVLHLPLLPGFVAGTTQGTNYSPGNQEPNDTKYWVILAALTIFHATTFFWIFTGGPLTFYLSFNVLGGHVGIGSFGVFTILIGFAGAQIVNLVLTNEIDATRLVANKEAHSIIVTVCIPCQFFTFIALYAHDWSWNKCNWINYLLLIITGVVNTIFVAYIYIMMGQLTGHGNVKKYQCLFYGIFYAITGAVVSFSMYFMFKSFGHDEPWLSIPCKCVKISLRYCFPTVYKGITLVFIAANAIALFGVWDRTHGYRYL